ncbi:hypothetical protein Patl1_04495 [Pistacia atlantica]|uniref:Uncharacterized protein n=1 Tax=Pistacia atlantica TaxID=434234 RepID=A0ACC1BRU5_9ROSI|nr:hypothetical protein Patl1_04495 [Pistacia atlantica]
MFAVIKSVNDSRKRKVVKIVLVVSTVAGFFILVLVPCKAWKKRKKKGKQEVQTLTSMEKRKGEIEVPLFDLATIAAATNNFSKANLIGEGGFGPVYKAWLLWNDGRALDLMDTCLEDSFIESLVQRCIQVGLLCVQKFPENRPEMSSVVFMLGNEEVVLPQPKQPGFFTEIGFSTDTTSSKDKLQTENALSITIQQGR